jgi:hypothetical protein
MRQNEVQSLPLLAQVASEEQGKADDGADNEADARGHSRRTIVGHSRDDQDDPASRKHGGKRAQEPTSGHETLV